MPLVDSDLSGENTMIATTRADMKPNAIFSIPIHPQRRSGFIRLHCFKQQYVTYETSLTPEALTDDRGQEG